MFWLAAAGVWLAAWSGCVGTPRSSNGYGLPEMQGVEILHQGEFTRLVLYFSGPVFHDERLGEGESELALTIRPAQLPRALEGFKGGARRGWRKTLDEGLLTQVTVASGEGDASVVVTMTGRALATHRTHVFEDPHRLVVDVFGGSPAAPQGAGEDALGSLVQAMSGEDVSGPQARRLVVVVDAGHGGFEPGATGPNGLHEKDVNLAIARGVADRLAQAPHVEVVLTRDTDVFLPLKERADIANRVGAELFVSIHANASTTPSLRGIETYYLNTATDAAAARLARAENEVAGGITYDLEDSVLDSLLRELRIDGQVSHGSALAERVQSALVGRLRDIYGPSTVRDLGVKTALFYVLVETEMPGILVETSFVSNPLEASRLSDPFYQGEVAEAISSGILAFVSEAHLLAPGQDEGGQYVPAP